MNLQCCTLFLKTESFKYILSKYWLSTIVFPESWPVLIHSSSPLIKGSVFWKYSILEVDLCISVSHYLVHNRRPKMNFLGKLLMQEIVIIIHFSWHFHGKTNCWYKCALWCNNSLLFLHFIFCRKRVVISGLCGWPFNFGPGEQQLHTNRQQYYIREWHNGLKSENIVPQ